MLLQVWLQFYFNLGTDVYVANNDKGKDNEIFFSSPGGEIKTYLLPSNTDNEPFFNGAMNNVNSPPATPTLNQQQEIRIVNKITLCLEYSTPQDYNMDSLQMYTRLLFINRPTFSTDYGLQDLFS